MNVSDDRWKIIGGVGVLFFGAILLVFGMQLGRQRQNIQSKATAATVLSVSPSSLNVSPGQQFTVNIMINTGSNQVLTVNPVLTFDPTLLTIVSLNQSTSFPQVTSQPTYGNGTAEITVAAPGLASPVSGTAIVATATFQAKSIDSGTATIGISGSSFVGDVSSGTQNVLQGTNPGTVYIGSTGPTPTPGNNNCNLTFALTLPSPTPSNTPIPTATPTPIPAHLGDFVWFDTNHNGIQEAGEAGIPNVTVNLYNSTGQLLQTTTTNSSGIYGFYVQPGSYIVEFVKPSGYTFSPAFQGTNTAVDSNSNTTTGRSEVVPIAAGENNLTIDSGMYVPNTPTPIPTNTPVPTNTPTPRPTNTPTPIPTNTPTPTPVPVCNSSCTTSAQCPSGMSCVATGQGSFCRNTACTTSATCVCPTPTPVPTNTPTPTHTPVPTPTNTPVPTATPTIPVGPQCIAIRVYLNGTVVTNLSSLQPGQTIVFGVAAGPTGLATAARLTINGVTTPQFSTLNSSNEFIYTYTIPTTATSLTVQAQILYNGVWQ